MGLDKVAEVYKKKKKIHIIYVIIIAQHYVYSNLSILLQQNIKIEIPLISMWLHIHELQFSVFKTETTSVSLHRRQICVTFADMNEPLTTTLMVNPNFRRSRYQTAPGSLILKSKANCLQ